MNNNKSEIVRVLNQKGIDEFRKYINELRKGNVSYSSPDLNNAEFSNEFVPNVKIEHKNFESRYEMAEYLHKKFHSEDTRNNISNKSGLWTWLAYYWFDIICPLNNGIRKIKEDVRYIHENSDDYRHFHRHLISVNYHIYNIHAEKSILLLYSPCYEHNDFIEQFASREFIISSRGLMDGAYDIYWDKTQKKPKKGSTSHNTICNIRRFISFIQQIELTYDIYNMEKNDILRLLPKEFLMENKK
jgi:hypothetical protein